MNFKNSIGKLRNRLKVAERICELEDGSEEITQNKGLNITKTENIKKWWRDMLDKITNSRTWLMWAPKEKREAIFKEIMAEIFW